MSDPNGITREDESAKGEQRFVTVGLDALARMLVVADTYRGDAIRMISARKATRNKVRTYDNTIAIYGEEVAWLTRPSSAIWATT